MGKKKREGKAVPFFLFRAPGKKTGSTGGTFMMRAYKRLFAGAIMMAALLLAGCVNLVSDLPQGQWLEEEQVQALVEDGIVFPDHRYYYLGSITAPDSFIAIHKEWRLRTRVWAEVEMTPQRLAGWLQWYRTEQYGICEYRGGRILAPIPRIDSIWCMCRNLRWLKCTNPTPGLVWSAVNPGMMDFFRARNEAGNVVCVICYDNNKQKRQRTAIPLIQANGCCRVHYDGVIGRPVPTAADNTAPTSWSIRGPSA
jgi:hypothetical protein